MAMSPRRSPIAARRSTPRINFSPDLVITDIQLPHVTGLDLIRLIRADDQLADVPIMAVTAYSARGDEERIRAAGAQAYVSKPISVMRFAQTVDQLLEHGHDGEIALERGMENNVTARRAPTRPGGEETSD